MGLPIRITSPRWDGRRPSPGLFGDRLPDRRVGCLMRRMHTLRLLMAIVALTLVGSGASATSTARPLDRGFGKDGKVTTRIGEESDARGAALQPDGKVVVAGETRTGDNWDFAVVRYRRNGALDLGFGTRGVTTTDFGGTSENGEAVQLHETARSSSRGAPTTRLHRVGWPATRAAVSSTDRLGTAARSPTRRAHTHARSRSNVTAT